MKAIYRGYLHTITNDTGEGVVLDGLYVPFGDVDLIIDPTDEQVEAAKAKLPIPIDADEEAEIREIVATYFPNFVDAVMKAWRQRRGYPD